VFLVNSRLTPFTAAQHASGSKSLHRAGHPFFRSYGAILPSSFCKTHSSTLGSSPHLPVSDYGTDTKRTRYEAFLGSMIRISWLALRLVPPSPLGVYGFRICLEALLRA
jgi:hypothetical protein